MKPIKLIMSAFGSYAGVAKIDFTRTDHGIFLITGDTGSGKTTIFDAIVYALYDRTSADARTPSDMRSQYADFETPTYVEFTFCYERGDLREVYTIKRNPPYTRRSKRKDKDGNYNETTERSTVELILPDQSTFNGRINETNEKIVEIVGLDYNQFTQTVMLAQGEFMRLLRASSNERKEIFGRIFNTRIYRTIQEKLRTASKELYIELEDNRKLCENELASVKGDNDVVFSFADNDHAALLSGIADLIKKGKDEEAKKRTGLKSAQEELSALNISKSLGERINSAYDNLSIAIENRKELEERNTEIKELEDKAAKAKKAQKVTPIVQKCSKQEKEISESAKRIEDYERRLSILAESLKQLEAKKLSVQSERAENEPRLRAELAKLEDELPLYEKADTLKAELDRLKTELADITSQEQKHRQSVEDKQQELVELHQAAKTASEIYERANDAFIAEQAGIMAASLNENEPCPVCGSTTHPNKAVLSESAISQAQVNNAKLERQKAEEKETKAMDELSVLKEKLEKYSSEHMHKNSACEIANAQYSDIKKRLRFDTRTAVEKQIESLKNGIVKLADAVQTAESAWQSERDKMTQLSGTLASEQEQQKRFVGELKTLTAELEFTMRAQGFESREDYSACVMSDEQLESAEQTLKTYNDECVRNSESIEQLTKQLNELKQNEGSQQERVDLSEISDKIEHLTTMTASLDGDANRLYAANQRNEEIYKKLTKLYERRAALKREYELYATLDKTANGNLSGVAKLDFQTYIQRRYFDAIIHEANKRLIKMSSGQFILQCRSLDRLGGQGAVGLDLDVYSMVNDKTRDVKTLSGGESFMAALSMALGMSDIIQNTAGRVQLDTMFVDEGFGSLDDEARDEAIKLLQELAGDRRLVGIISHVTELKEQIDQKLIVKKDESGSSVCWQNE